MEIFNIGLPELIIIVIIGLVLLGPKDMMLTAYRAGRWFRNLTRSALWKEMMSSVDEIRSIPKTLMDEAEFDDLKETFAELKGTTQQFTADVKNQFNEALAEAQPPVLEEIPDDDPLPAHTLMPPPAGEVVPTPPVPVYASGVVSTPPPAPVSEPAGWQYGGMVEPASSAFLSTPEPALPLSAAMRPRRMRSASLGEVHRDLPAPDFNIDPVSQNGSGRQSFTPRRVRGASQSLEENQ